jgi:hypothetical protein
MYADMENEGLDGGEADMLAVILKDMEKRDMIEREQWPAYCPVVIKAFVS